MTRMTVEARMAELRRMRWLLLALTLAFAVLGFFTGPLLLAIVIVCLILAIRNELVSRQGRRLLAAQPLGREQDRNRGHSEGAGS